MTRMLRLHCRPSSKVSPHTPLPTPAASATAQTPAAPPSETPVAAATAPAGTRPVSPRAPARSARPPRGAESLPSPPAAESPRLWSAHRSRAAGRSARCWYQGCYPGPGRAHAPRLRSAGAGTRPAATRYSHPGADA